MSDDQLPPEMLRMLQLAREASNPTDDDRERIRRNVLAAAALIAATGAAHTAATAGASAGQVASAGSALKAGVSGTAALLGASAKWVAAAVLTGALGSATYYTLQPQQPNGKAKTHATVAATAHRGAQSSAKAVPFSAATPVPALVPAATAATNPEPVMPQAGKPEAAAIVPSQSIALPAPRHMPAMRARTATVSQLTAAPASQLNEKATAPSASQPTAASLPVASTIPPAPAAQPALAKPSSATDDEISLVRRAAATLRAGRPGDALTLLSEHAARFPNGVMGEERDGLRVLSLCAMGDSALARREATLFLTHSPNSPLAGHIRKECAEGP